MDVNTTSKSLLQCVLDASQNGILVYEAVSTEQGEIIDLRLTMFNRTFERDSGCPAQELLGHSFKQAAHFLAKMGIFERYCRVLETGNPDRFELSFTHPGQSNPVWHDVSVVPHGNFLVISYLDITELKTQKEALLKAEVLQHSFSASINGITVLQAIHDATGAIVDFRFTMINETGLQMAGMSRDQVIGRTMREIYPQTQSQGMYLTYVRVCQTGKPFSGEHFYPEYDVWRQMSIVPVQGGVMITYNDISERKRIERIRQQQAELLWAIFDNTQIGLSLLEPVLSEEDGHLIDFSYTLTNPANASQVQWTVEQMKGQRIQTLFPELEGTDFYKNLLEVAQTGDSKRFLYTYTADNFKGWYDCIMVRLGNGVLLSALDVSESYQHQQQLELVNRELSLSNDNLQQFAYAASHDLQEPLRKIKAFGDLLVHQFSANLNADIVDIIQRMQSASERMSILIRDLLAYSRISTHQEPFEEVALSEMLNSIIDSLELTIQQTSAKVHIGKMPTVHGDASQLQQLFQHLLVNALKFCKTDDVPAIQIESRLIVGVELDREPFSQIIVESKFADDHRRAYFEITITDNGIGFEQQYATRIFQVFQRLHGRSLYEGSGIGLAICKKVVDNHRGAIAAMSQPGVGTTFAVYLPVHR